VCSHAIIDIFTILAKIVKRMSFSTIIVALAFLAISGGLFRYATFKAGTKVVYLIYFVAIVTLIIFIFMCFKGCNDSTDPFRDLNKENGTSDGY
jgi:hypothetical protein